METTSNQTNTAPIRKSRIGTVIWVVLSLLISFMAAASGLSPRVSHAGSKFLFVWLAATLLGVIGVRIGDALRRALKPDFIVTTGGFQGLLVAKIFWSIGPQCAGLLIGTLIGCSVLWDWVA